MNRWKSIAKVLCGLCLLAAALSACAQPPMSAGHLKRDTWSLEEPRSLITNFMRFDYQVLPVGEAAGIKGWAYLDVAKLPQNAKWLESVSLSAYLCDPDGRVIAQDTRSFLPREVRADDGIGFEFTLKPEAWDNKPLFVAFGYRLVLTASREAGPGQSPFFANEDAISRDVKK